MERCNEAISPRKRQARRLRALSTDPILLTSVIDALERRDVVATVDIPNAFVQTVAEAEKDYRVIVRLRGRIVEILCEIAPEVYLPYVTVNKKGEKILIVQCLNALYGTMVASLLYYKKFVKSLERHGFKLNPYDSLRRWSMKRSSGSGMSMR
jgi:hypothetical protein